MSKTRQLIAIMFTDIVGYTVLMGNDEQKAFGLLVKNRALQKPAIEQFNGRWIKEMGDGVMASFTTVTEAVGAAIQIQEACEQANDFQLRIGIHLGEVVFENDDVFGDGVNIAARIQSLARPGCIYISESVHHNVSNKKHIHTKFIGEEILKNVKEPVRIYEVILKNGRVPVPDNLVKEIRVNSIAVLPFSNMSSDPEQEYFSDGLTEEIISDLSGLKKLLVISRSSIMTLKGTQKKIKEIAGELNVRYILEGSVRKSGNNLRITAQLIDATHDTHIWSEKFNGTLEDVFEIQEKVSRSIVDALRLKLTPEEVLQITARPITHVHAYESYLKARQEMMRGSKESMDNAVQLIQNAIDLIGPNDLLYAMLGYAHFFYFRFINKADRSNFLKAQEYAERSFSLNPDCALGHVVKGWIYWTEGNLQESCNSMKRALSFEPNNYDALFGLGEVYLYAGRANTTHWVGDKLLEIDPLTPMTHIMKGSYFLDSSINDVVLCFEKAYTMDPQGPINQWMLAIGYFWAGRVDDGVAIVDILSKTAPDWTFTKQVLFLQYGIEGNKELALTYATDELEAEAKNDHHFAFHLAECFAVIGEKEKALDLLEFAMKIFFPYIFLSANLLFANIRGEERFQKMMDDAKLRSDSFVI